MSDELDLNVLAESFAEFLAGEWPREKAISYERSGEAYDTTLWDSMCNLGWTALTAPENHGGLGMGIGAAAYLHSALGAAAAPSPMLGTLLATTMLGASGAEAAADAMLPGVIDGSLRIAIADPRLPAVIADGNVVSGVARNLIDAPAANVFLLRGRQDGQCCWIAIDAEATGVLIERHALADTTHTIADVTLANTPIDENRLIRPKDPTALDALLTRHACIAIAADALGGGETVLAVTIDYMKVREQFGRVIGSFQALKHRVADHHTALVGARELVMHAALLPDSDPEAMLAALSTKAHVTRVVAEIARDCIQLHGGVGFTSEFIPHLYLKRGKLNEALYGTRTELLDRVADMLEAA